MQKQLDADLAALRRDFPDYDRWTLADLSRLNAWDIRWFRAAIILAPRDWYGAIPEAVRTRYGANAPRLFVAEIYDRTDHLGILDDHMERLMAGQITFRLGLTTEQQESLDLRQAHEIRLRDRTSGEVVSTVRTTLAEAMYHQINREILEPRELPPGQYHNPHGRRVNLPDSIIDGIIASNPHLRTQLGRLRSTTVPLVIRPRHAYDAGQVAQRRRRNAIRDWSTRSHDPATICPQIAQIEVDVFDPEPDDVQMTEAWVAGSVRASKVCP